MMKKKYEKQTDLIGTFLNSGATQKHSQSESSDPTDVIMKVLRARDGLQLNDLMEIVGGSVKANIEAIKELESFGLVRRDTDGDGNQVLKRTE